MSEQWLYAANLQAGSRVIAHCRAIAEFTEERGMISRTFLSAPMRKCHSYLDGWAKDLGMHVYVDAAGNWRGVYAGIDPDAGRIIIGSHLDTVPDAGAFDGVLGVVLGVALVEALAGQRLPFAIEVIGFSEEEGVRFGMPFIGSSAFIGDLDESALDVRDDAGVTLRDAISQFGLNPGDLAKSKMDAAARAYLEFHIEQGPVLDDLQLPLGIVQAIAGQTRGTAVFRGMANHAGTTPMHLRRDALCAAAEWISDVERHARAADGLVATVGKIDALPGASNAIPGIVTLSLDVRHATDAVRRAAVDAMVGFAKDRARRRALNFEFSEMLDQAATPMHAGLMRLAEEALRDEGIRPHKMTSGAGHDAMIVARKLPCAMIFLRSPGGISHHPSETVVEADVELAVRSGIRLLRSLSAWI